MSREAQGKWAILGHYRDWRSERESAHDRTVEHGLAGYVVNRDRPDPVGPVRNPCNADTCVVSGT